MNRTAAIIGVGPGLGLALAHRFGREGFRLGLIARSQDKPAQYEEELRQAGITALGLSADASDATAMGESFGTLWREFGAPDVLIYNAVRFHSGAVSHLEPAQLMQDLQVSVNGALIAVREVLPEMRERGHGTILFTGGGAALGPSVGAASLSITKAALRNLALSLAAEFKESNLRVGTVTVAGAVQPDTAFAAERIAEVFWKMHTGEIAEPERIFRGES